MGEHSDILSTLGGHRAVDAIRWAFRSASDRTLNDYSEAAGHDATWLGTTRFVLMRDRLDRVFSCGRYAVSNPELADLGSDVVLEELSKSDVETMPHIDPTLAIRDDLNGSPGWGIDGWRFLLASFDHGKVHEIPWPRKSPTKQAVAGQPNPDPAQQGLFDEVDPEWTAGFLSLTVTPIEASKTLVVAHSLDPLRQEGGLYLGRPSLNTRGGPAWHWVENLLMLPDNGGGRRPVEEPKAPSGDPVADAPVRLRKPAAEAKNPSESA